MKHKDRDIDPAQIFAPRIYTRFELEDFHQKIKRFRGEPRTLEDGTVAQKFDHQALQVAYGACRKVESGAGKFHYLYDSERFLALDNLWNQYEDWRRKQDWIDNKRSEGLEKIAEEVPF